MLSIAWVSRNDNHGNGLVPRIQSALNALAEYHKQGLNLEVIFIEWNPPPNVPRLHELLTWNIPIRWYEVSPEIYQQFPNWEQLDIMPHIGTNIAMRRAKGDWVLSTSSDCIFSAGLAKTLAVERFLDDHFYRACRFDAHGSPLPNLSVAEHIAYMESHMLRRNTWKSGIYTKSSGDFILTSRSKWHEHRGYIEWPMNGIWLDGHLLYAMAAAGMKQTVLSDPLYHMEHKDRGLHIYERMPHMPWKKFKRLAGIMLKNHQPFELNHEGWGLANVKEKQVAENRWILHGIYKHPELRHWDDLLAKGR